MTKMSGLPSSAGMFTLASVFFSSAAIANAPRIYSFASQIDSGDSVNYTGQTFRQVLINDLTAFVKSLKAGNYSGTETELVNALNSYFAYSYDAPLLTEGAINGFSAIKLKAKSLNGDAIALSEGSTYEEIFEGNKDLRGKLAGNDNALVNGELLGWSASFDGIELASIDYDQKGDDFVEPEDLIQAMFQKFADNAVNGSSFIADDGLDGVRINDAFVTADGLDYAQLLQKFLHGALSFSQATRDYLSTDLGSSKGLNAQNETAAKAGVNYTNLEHHWDEAFGYFGAARDFLNYTDEQIAKGFSIDTNDNGSISIESEFNFPLAKSAAKRDRGAGGDTDFTAEIMGYFLEGRRLIAEKPAGYRNAIVKQATSVINAWEASLAATVIHYINRYISETKEYATSEYNFKDMAKFWGEMKGYGLAFQFNPQSVLSTEGFKAMHDLMGSKPVKPSDAQALASYHKDLLKARDLLKTAFEFSTETVENW